MGTIHADLVAAKKLVYEPNGFICSQPVAETESAEYGAHELTVDGLSVRFRAAKTTPKKVGQFVTVWKRSAEGPIQPFDAADPVDLFVVSCRDRGHFGQFVFPRDVLCEQGIVSRAGVGGKRAFRVYPPWVLPTARQARSTQVWQADYFLTIPEGHPADSTRAGALYHP
ncbi:MepB family protein [Kitasatospora sp. NPDC097691]|uniref:MepB family protein n=1 Tax=Kitasatospora sp. NPDC097691 TaxID=3157231 RepID=UPI00331E66B1